MLEFCLLCVLQHLSASPASFCLKTIDEENSERKKKNSKKLERKGGRKRTRERGGKERDKERGTLLGG